MKSRFKFSLVAVGLAGAAVSCFAGGKVELVPVSEVRILDTSVFAPAVKAVASLMCGSCPPNDCEAEAES